MFGRVGIVLLSLFLMAVTSFAATPEDFTYKGVALGDTSTAMVEKLGEARSEITHLEKNGMMTYYYYGDNRILVDARSQEVVEMIIVDKAYETNHGVKVGATLFKINQAYGKGEKIRDKGKLYYVYRREDHPEQRLLLDITDDYLKEIKITTLTD